MEYLNPCLESSQRCAICLFPLPADATKLKPLGSHPLDVLPADLTEEELVQKVASLKASGKTVSVTAVQASASRGCHICMALQKQYTFCKRRYSGKSFIDSLNDAEVVVEWGQERGNVHMKSSNFDEYFELFTDSEEANDPASRPSKEHPFIKELSFMSGGNGSDLVIQKISSWLARCATHHQSYRCPADGFIPKRLIEISNNGAVKLIETKTVNERMGPYACLSHRWGPSTSNSILKTSNLGEYRRDIPLHILPKLFNDVFSIVKRLGLFYVWIDCLCIIQDSEADWRDQAGSMADIYEHAAFTIAATGSNDSSNSLFRKWDAGKYIQIGDLGGRKVYIRSDREHPVQNKNEILLHGAGPHFPLLGRGWVFQERELSKRFIQFGPWEVLCECFESTWCECRPEGEWAARRVNQRQRKLGEDSSWVEIVKMYKPLRLTFDKDILPAIAGVAKAFARDHGGNYIAGLWKEDLPAQLIWESLAKEKIYLHPRPEKRNAPTRSWASIGGPVGWYRSEEKSNLLQIMEAHTGETGADDHYLTAKHARLKVRGQTIKAKVYYDLEWRRLVRASSLSKKVQAETVLGILSSDSFEDKDPRERVVAGIEIYGRLLNFYPDYSFHLTGSSHVASGSEVRFLLCGSENNGEWFVRTGLMEGPEDNLIHPFGLVLRCLDEEQQIFERIGFLAKDDHKLEPHFPLLEDLRDLQTETLILV